MSRKDLFYLLSSLLKNRIIKETMSKAVKSVTFRTISMSGFGGGLAAYVVNDSYFNFNSKRTKFVDFMTIPYGALIGQYCIMHYKPKPNFQKYSFYQSLLGALVAFATFHHLDALLKQTR